MLTQHADWVQTLGDSRDKTPAADTSALEKAIEDLKSAVGADSVADIEAKTKALRTATSNLGAKVHESAAGGPGAESKSSDEVIDADFEEVDDKNNKRRP